MKNNKQTQSLENSAKEVADKIISIVPNTTSANKIVREVILPTIGSKADIMFWEMVAQNII